MNSSLITPVLGHSAISWQKQNLVRKWDYSLQKDFLFTSTKVWFVSYTIKKILTSQLRTKMTRSINRQSQAWPDVFISWRNFTSKGLPHACLYYVMGIQRWWGRPTIKTLEVTDTHIVKKMHDRCKAITAKPPIIT